MNKLRAIVPEALGIEPLMVGGAHKPGWSPNIVQSISIHADAAEVGVFPGVDKDLTYFGTDRNVSFTVGFEDPRDTGYRALEDIYIGVFPNLEELNYHGIDITDTTLRQHFPRLQRVNGQDTGWGTDVPLTVEADKYQVDHMLSEYADNVLSGLTKEEISEDDKQLIATIKQRYGSHQKQSIDRVMQVYRHLFASGYEVEIPYGMLVNNPGYSGIGAILTINTNGDTELTDKLNTVATDLYEEIMNKLSFQERNERVVHEIATLIANDSNSPYYYFPYKLIEYMYGKVATVKPDGTISYETNSHSKTWEEYSKLVRKDIEEVYDRLILENHKQREGEHPVSQGYGDALKSLYDRAESALTNCILVPKFEKTNKEGIEDLFSVRLRVSQTRTLTGVSFATSNVLRDFLIREQISGDAKGSSFEPTVCTVPELGADKAPLVIEISTHQHNLDTVLANAEPKFTYKAVEELTKRGKKISWDNMLIGVDTNSNVISSGNGKLIDFSKNFGHLIIAGSRSGKGVMTQSLKQGIFSAQRPLFYLDNKPDMASLLRVINPDAFTVNGNDLVHNPSTGTDLFSTFVNEDMRIPDYATPEYVIDGLGVPGATHESLGGLYYFRALNLIWGILAARAAFTDEVQNLGGEDGITVIVDELANAERGFNAVMTTIAGNQASTGYFAKFKGWIARAEKAAEEGRSIPNEPDNKPTPFNFWAREVVNMLRGTTDEIRRMQNAVFKNNEARISDMFVITQQPTMYSLDKSNNREDNLAPIPNSAQNTRKITNNITALGYMALPYAFDAFIGYQSDASSNPDLDYLGQSDRSSTTGQRLSQVERNFAYVPTLEFDKITKKRDGLLYIKPYFVLADGSEDAYPAANMIKVVEKNGISREELVSRYMDQEEFERTGGTVRRLSPKVGFLECLETTGTSIEQARASLQRASDAADYFLQKIGYTGGWKSFVYDLRPQWQLSVRDMVSAFGGRYNVQDVEKNLNEFYIIYPGCFDEVNQVSKDWENLEDDWMNDFQPEPRGFDAVGEDDTQVSQTTVDLEETVIENIFSDDEEQPSYQINPGWFQRVASSLRGTLGNPDQAEVDNFEAPQDFDFNAPNGAVPFATGDSVKIEYETPAVVPAFEAPELAPYDPMAINVYRGWVTNELLNAYGGPEGVQRITIVDSSVAVNGQVFTLNIDDTTLSRIPFSLRVAVKNGAMLGSIDWGVLRILKRLRTLEVSSYSVISEYLWPAVSEENLKRSKLVEQVFNRFAMLDTLNIAGNVYYRETYKTQQFEGDPYNKAGKGFSAVDDATTFTSTWSARFGINSTEFVRDLWGNPKRSFLTKMVGTVVGATGAAAGGTAWVAAKTTNRINRSLKNFLDVIMDKGNEQ